MEVVRIYLRWFLLFDFLLSVVSLSCGTFPLLFPIHKYSFKSKHSFYEKEVLDSTDYIIVCTESAYNNFKKNSNNQISLIRNGYDPADFKEIDKYINQNNSEIIIAYCGRINTLHSLTNFFKALCKLKTKYNSFPFKVKIIGSGSNKWMKSYGIIEEDVEFIDYLPPLCQDDTGHFSTLN